MLGENAQFRRPLCRLLAPLVIVLLMPSYLLACFPTTCPPVIPCPTPTPASASCRIPLTQSQLAEIENALPFIDALLANKTYAYSNQVPIVTDFTSEQQSMILENLGRYGMRRLINLTLWDTVIAHNSPISISDTYHDNPDMTTRRRRRNTGAVSICPVDDVLDVLVTAYNANDDLVQIVQFGGFSQPVLRQKCRESSSPHGKLHSSDQGDSGVDILCYEVARPAFLVAVRLNGASHEIEVEEVQVESCSTGF